MPDLNRFFRQLKVELPRLGRIGMRADDPKLHSRISEYRKSGVGQTVQIVEEWLAFVGFVAGDWIGLYSVEEPVKDSLALMLEGRIAVAQLTPSDVSVARYHSPLHRGDDFQSIGFLPCHGAISQNLPKLIRFLRSERRFNFVDHLKFQLFDHR